MLDAGEIVTLKSGPANSKELPLPVFAALRLGRPGNGCRRPRADVTAASPRSRRPGSDRSDPGVNVEPVIFLGRQREQRLPERTLDRPQLLPARLLFLGAALLFDDLDELALKRLQRLAQRRIGARRG